MDTEIRPTIAYQTGEIREKVLTENLQEKFSKNFTFVSSDNNNRVCIREFLSHKNEAEGEMADFKENFGYLFRQSPSVDVRLTMTDKNRKTILDNLISSDLFKDYNVFLSIGSTSTQGWCIYPNDVYKVIIPSDAPTNNFMKLGARIDDPDLIKAGISDLDVILGNLERDTSFGRPIKILCFNAIGYSIPDNFITSKNNGFANVVDISSLYPNSSLLVKSLAQSSYKKQMDKTQMDKTQMDIFARNIKINGIQLGGSWASGLARMNKVNIIDIGGGAVHIYQAVTGFKITENKPLEYGIGENKTPINPNNVYFTDENGKKTTPTTDELLKSDITLLGQIRTSLELFIMLKSFKAGGRKKSKRRKTKRKRSKRRHR
jgi:hypothetical protein